MAEIKPCWKSLDVRPADFRCFEVKACGNRQEPNEALDVGCERTLLRPCRADLEIIRGRLTSLGDLPSQRNGCFKVCSHEKDDQCLQNNEENMGVFEGRMRHLQDRRVNAAEVTLNIDNIISGSMLFYRLRRMDFGPTILQSLVHLPGASAPLCCGFRLYKIGTNVL